MKLYQVSGIYNKRPIKTKCFKNSLKAFKYLDKVLFDLNVEIDEVLTTEENLTTYVVDNYTRFSVEKL